MLVNMLCALLALLASPILALPFSEDLYSNYRLKEAHPIAKQWQKLYSAPSEERLALQFGLKQGNFAELERHLMEVSDPSHHRYGQHLSAQEVDDLVRPTQETTDLVYEWLSAHGIESHHIQNSHSGDLITVHIPVKLAEELLQTKYSVYRHSDNGEELIRTPDFSLPDFLHEHVQSVQPTTYFASIRSMSSNLKKVKMSPAVNSNVGSVCNATAVTIECLREYYQTANYTPQVPEKNLFGITGFLGENGNFSDLNVFTQVYAPYAIGANFSVETIGGAINDQVLNETQYNATTNAEAGLDLQTAVGITFPTNITFYDTAGMPPFTPDNFSETNYPGQQTNEPYLVLIDYLSNLSTIPNTLSLSYGENEETVPFSYATQVCQGFARLGARGMSIFVSSGDSGVGATGFCQSNNGSDAFKFQPAFPASCPYVTTVGATTGFSPEVAANDSVIDYFSGGGFSNYFSRPSWQNQSVLNYIDDTIDGMYTGFYNKSGRGYPDVAAAGQRVQTIWNASELTLDGTSASAPLFASIITLVNDALIAHGKSPLGYLNPAIYASNFSAAFHDITNGSSAGCGTDGFPAAVGWDAVTGLGSPNFLTMLEILGVSSNSPSNSTAPSSATSSASMSMSAPASASVAASTA